MLSTIPDPAVALSQLGVAIGGALIFALIGLVVILTAHRLSSSAVSILAAGARKADDFLVRRVSRWLGLSETRPFRRWGRMIAWFMGLSLIGAFAPAILATPALVAGLVAIIAVFRRWSWDEEDRALNLAAHHKRMPGAEDFNDELLAGLGGIFMFGSLLIWRLSELRIFDDGHARGLIGGLLYVASETLEALPVIGNVQVLGYANPSGVEVVQPRGGWVAFALRMLLDLLVIGGLLKAAAIAGRVAGGLDLRRHETALSAADSEAEVSTALDAVTDLARRGNVQAAHFLEVTALPPPDHPGIRPAVRRAAADRLVDLSSEGAMIGPGGLAAAQMAYDVLLTPELQQADPIEWNRCRAARAQALYMTGIQVGGAQGAEKLAAAQAEFQQAARALDALGAMRWADRAELGYWAAMTEWITLTAPETETEDLARLSEGVADYIERLLRDTGAEPAVLREARSLQHRLTTLRRLAGDDMGDMDLAGSAEGVGEVQALMDRAALARTTMRSTPSDQTLAELRGVMADLERFHASAEHAGNKSARATAALRLAQCWRTCAEVIHDESQPNSADQALHWCEESRRLAERSAPRLMAMVGEIEAYCLSVKAARMSPGQERDAMLERSLESYRRLIHDPAMSADPLIVEARSNMVIALIGAATGYDALSRSRLREAVSLSEALLDQASLNDQEQAAVRLNASNAQRMLAAREPTDERKPLLEKAAAWAQESAQQFERMDNRHGQALAQSSLGHAHEAICALENAGEDAVKHARLAHQAHTRALALLDPQRHFGLWYECERENAALMVFLAVEDNDKSLIEAAIARLDVLLGAVQAGPYVAQAPFLEQQRAKALGLLKDWKG